MNASSYSRVSVFRDSQEGDAVSHYVFCQDGFHACGD